MSKPFVTASAIERVVECPASAVMPQTQSTNVHSKRGNHEHADIESVILGLKEKTSSGYSRQDLELPTEPIPEIAFSYDCVTGNSNEIGRVAGRDYPKAPFSTIYGTADVAGIGSIVVSDGVRDSQHMTVDIVDWKTTFEPPPPDSWQMRLLAFMAARARGLKYARTRITHIKNGIFHSKWKLWNDEDFKGTEILLKKTYDSVNRLGWKEEITLADVKFGPHCHFCPAYLSCPYPKSLLKNNGPDDQASILTDTDAANTYLKWQAMRTLTGRLEDAVKGYAAIRPIHIGNGYMFGKPSQASGFRKYKVYASEED